MSQLASLFFLYAACALLCDAERPTTHGFVRTVGAPRALGFARLAAAALALAAWVGFRLREPGPGSSFLLAMGLTAVGTAVALSAALWPRVVSLGAIALAILFGILDVLLGGP